MASVRTNFTAPIKEEVPCVAACRGNAITKEYFSFLQGEINRGTIRKVVCSKYYKEFDYTTYHLISI